MNLPRQISEQIKGFHYGPNATGVNLKMALEGVDWKMATTRVDSLNTIAELVFHINYYVEAVLGVLKGKPLTAHDKYSFDLPPIKSQADWEQLLNKVWKEADEMIEIVAGLDDSKLAEVFVKEKYGNYYRNLTGICEHSNYHIGQISMLKKIIREASEQA
ncbi:MAG: hypothetical protein Kow0027_17970 [Saprospiraceae bacterium]|nr:DUF1572 domain-containing protein [Saprospirales bacterium]